MSSTTSILKDVARKLRYRVLSEFIGQEVEIHSLETIEADIRRAYGELWPEKCTLIDKSVSPLAITKYGILDLRFLVADNKLVSDYQTGIPLLKDLAFVVPLEKEEELKESARVLGDKFADDPTCLKELAEDLAKEQTLLKLFFRGEAGVAIYLAQDLPIEEKVKYMESPTLPPGYFPQVFTATDACFTNADFVWFHKHFYF
jgi:hypothetical protein